jgi:hypothetical protein
MKKRAPPKASKVDLMMEAYGLLNLRFRHHSEAVSFLLTYFNGWDLEEVIRHLKDTKNWEA